MDTIRRFFEELEQGVGGFLHESGGSEDEDAGRGFGGNIVSARNQGADLADFDEVLRRSGWNDEDVWMGLDQDAGVFPIAFAHLLAGGNGFGNAGFQVGGFGDAGAVAACSAKRGERATGLIVIAGLALALER